MADTAIEWADRVWNPTTGCDRVSPGCDHCYAMTMAKRLKGMGSAKYQRDGDPRTSGPGFGVSVHPDALDLPLKWRKPQRIFVNSMSDLFHDQVPDEYIARVFAVMALAPEHTFQLLTKRHGRMRSLLDDDQFIRKAWIECDDVVAREYRAGFVDWPLPNVWLGVSAENQQWATIRGNALRETPAAVRFYSFEPLLGPVDDANLDGIHWAITGGESGPGARPAHPDWFRSIRDQCQAAGVAYLHKQHGEWVPESMCLHGANAPAAFLSADGRVRPLSNGKPAEPPMSRGQDITIRRVGKHRAGRELDGRTWDQYPQAVTHA